MVEWSQVNPMVRSIRWLTRIPCVRMNLQFDWTGSFKGTIKFLILKRASTSAQGFLINYIIQNHDYFWQMVKQNSIRAHEVKQKIQLLHCICSFFFQNGHSRVHWGLTILYKNMVIFNKWLIRTPCARKRNRQYD